MLSGADVSIAEVLRYFTSKGIEATFLVPTETGMKKSIMDATAPVREFFKSSRIHDFESQPQGQDHKRFIETQVVTSAGIFRTRTSVYRPCTKQGDPRIWVYGLASYASPGNVLALLAKADGELIIINASSAGLVPGVTSASNGALLIRDATNFDLGRFLAPLVSHTTAIADELLGLIRSHAGTWHQGLAGVRRDFEVGRLLEELLGIKANSSRAPDFKGIEIKASRGHAGTRQTLFARVPDWSTSPFKSSREILDVFGYMRNPKYERQLRCTVSARSPNSQGLHLVVEDSSDRLLEASTLPAYPKVAYWPIQTLKAALLEKHPETFWVSASSRAEAGREFFRYEKVLHTRKPMANALPALLEAGVITVDHLITRTLVGKVSEQGPLFKISRKNFDLLFPPGRLHIL